MIDLLNKSTTSFQTDYNSNEFIWTCLYFADRTKTPTESKEDQIHVCPYCNYSSVNEMRIQAHVISQHSQNDSKILCPLCQEDFKEKRGLEKHLMNTHSVKPEGLQRLLLMVDQGDWMMPPTSIPTVTPFMPIDESGEINTEALEAEAARLAAEEGKQQIII